MTRAAEAHGARSDFAVGAKGAPENLNNGAHQGSMAGIGLIKSALAELAALEVPLVDIPEPGACPVCRSSMTRATVDYEYDYWLDDHIRFSFARRLPGYLCDEVICSAVVRDTATNDTFLRAVAEDLAKLGDMKLSERLRLRRADPATYTTFSEVPDLANHRVPSHP